MPGSIQVSVLGLMDLPLPPPLSSLSLTVAMGKREYRTVGGGELSLPVVSLRENLIVMVYAANGEVILRTEFKTMLLLERGLCYNLFPLNNGGTLHMKLQFLLSEEDQKRIREMRDSALKRRCMEKPRPRHRRSFSDDRIGYLPTTTIAETITKGMLLDHSEPTDPIVEPYFGQKVKFPASRISMGGFPRRTAMEGDASNLNFCQTMPKSFSVGMLSEISSEGKSKPVKKSFLFKKETENCETLGHKDLKYNEKIHKLDISTELIKEAKNKTSDSGTYMRIGNGPQTIDYGKSSRLTAPGIFGEEKDFVCVNVEKGPSIIPIIRNFETVTEKGNLNLLQRARGGLGSNATSGTFKKISVPHGSAKLVNDGAEHDIARKKCNDRKLAGDETTTSSERVDRKIDTAAIDGNNNEERNLKKRNDRKLAGDGTSTSSEGVDRKIDTAAIDENNNEERNLKKRNDRKLAGDGTSTSSEGVDKKIDTTTIDENNYEERNLQSESLPLNKMLDDVEKTDHTRRQGTSGEVARAGSDETTARAEHSSRISSAHRYATSSEGVDRKTETFDFNEKNGEEQSLGEKSLLHQQGRTSIQVNDENNLETHSVEQVDPGSSCEQVEALKSGYSSVCSIGILDTWIPRHVCFTTGSKLLREFAESSAVSLESNPIESSSMGEAETKKDGDAYIQGNESKVLPSFGNTCTENSSSSLESNGGLIEQVAFSSAALVDS